MHPDANPHSNCSVWVLGSHRKYFQTIPGEKTAIFICLDTLKICVLIGQLIRNSSHLILTYKIVYLKWTNLKLYYFPECLLCRPDGLHLISKTNIKSLDGICASVTPASLCKTGNRDRRMPRSSGTSGTGVQCTAETSRESCFSKAEGEYQLQEVVLYPSHMYCSLLCMHTR